MGCAAITWQVDGARLRSFLHRSQYRGIRGVCLASYLRHDPYSSPRVLRCLRLRSRTGRGGGGRFLGLFSWRELVVAVSRLLEASRSRAAPTTDSVRQVDAKKRKGPSAANRKGARNHDLNYAFDLRHDLARAERHRGEQELGRRREASRTACSRTTPFIWRRHSCSAFARQVAGPRRDLHAVRTKGNLAAMLPAAQETQRGHRKPAPNGFAGDLMSQGGVGFDRGAAE